MQEKVYIICGPTASGKSKKAIEFAMNNNGVIINADSQQVFADLSLLTACPSEEDKQMVPHKLYQFISGDKKIDAFAWSEMASQSVREVLANGQVPIIVGGTGFYIKSLVEGLTIFPQIPENIRIMVRKEGRTKKLVELLDIVKKYDPQLAERVNPNDRQRILRGIEVFRATGVPLSQWLRERKIKPLADVEFVVDIIDAPISELEVNIANRFDSMFQNGMVDEVVAMLNKEYNDGAAIYKIIGVNEVRAFIRGEITLDEMRAKIILLSRQYAKRQRTFFRTQLNVIK